MKGTLEFFSSIYGEYPFKNEKYGHVEYTFGGGMENQTASYMGTGALSNEGILAHELAHQWWGDNVTCDKWNHIWVNEGFATFSKIIYDEKKAGNFNGGNAERSTIKNGAKYDTGTVYRYDVEVTMESEHTKKIFNQQMVYWKGSIVVSMLRKLVGGDTAFFNTLKRIQTVDSLEYNHAITEDIKHHFEATTGLDLDSFFDDFIYKAGYAKYIVNWGKTASAPYFTAINYTQGKSTGSTVAYYNTVLPIRLRNTGLGRDTMIYIFDQPSLAGTDQYFQTSFPITSIEVDPYFEAYTYDWIINAPTTILPLQLTSFTGTKKGKEALLEWQTEAMKDFSHFELLKSADGIQ
ncbi:MAG: M1 family aminopeptidase, partial [Chitinophagaceae bacterium]